MHGRFPLLPVATQWGSSCYLDIYGGILPLPLVNDFREVILEVDGIVGDSMDNDSIVWFVALSSFVCIVPFSIDFSRSLCIVLCVKLEPYHCAAYSADACHSRLVVMLRGVVDDFLKTCCDILCMGVAD